MSATTTHARFSRRTRARRDVRARRRSGLEDAEGRRYLDLLGGIAVVGLGHLHPAPLAAAHAQLDKLWHVSNLYWTEPMERLATLLSERFGGAHAFFCNSGAEASRPRSSSRARRRAGRASSRSRTRSTDAARRAVGHRPALEARRLRAAPPGRRVREAERLGVARSRRRRRHRHASSIEPIQGEGGIIRLGRVPRAGTRACRRTRRTARPRRGADGRRPHRHFFAWEQLDRAATP